MKIRGPTHIDSDWTAEIEPSTCPCSAGEHFCDFIDETVGKLTIPIIPNAVKKKTQVMLSTISRYLRTAQQTTFSRSGHSKRSCPWTNDDKVGSVHPRKKETLTIRPRIITRRSPRLTMSGLSAMVMLPTG